MTDAAQAIALFSDLIKAAQGDKPKDGAFKNIEASLEWQGKKMVLPAEPSPMSTKDARLWLDRFDKMEGEAIAIHAPINAYPWDGAVAFMRAMKELYGWASPVPTPGFFGPQPPHMVDIETNVGERMTIFWGSFMLPGIEGLLSTEWGQIEGHPAFTIGGKVKRKNVEAVHVLAELTRKFVAEQSIYRGKALRLLTDEDGAINANEPPKFIDLSRVNRDELVFGTELMEQVTTNLFTPIMHTARCRENKVPLKRGVLLYGPYGTGKTLCASVTATLCAPNGWTFITVGRVTALEQALRMAALYQPCVVFVEDIDREVAGDRTAKMDDILNTIDGIISKGAEIMVVLTSNHAEQINRAMLRPGRLDAALHIEPPTADAVERLLRVYGRTLINPEASLAKSAKVLAGEIPAVIRECVERAKLYAISQRPDAKEFWLLDEDIERAAASMKHHLALLRGPVPEDETPEHKLGVQLGRVLNHHLGNGSDEGLSKKVKEIDSILRVMATEMGVVLD